MWELVPLEEHAFSRAWKWDDLDSRCEASDQGWRCPAGAAADANLPGGRFVLRNRASGAVAKDPRCLRVPLASPPSPALDAYTGGLEATMSTLPLTSPNIPNEDSTLPLSSTFTTPTYFRYR